MKRSSLLRCVLASFFLLSAQPSPGVTESNGASENVTPEPETPQKTREALAAAFELWRVGPAAGFRPGLSYAAGGPVIALSMDLIAPDEFGYKKRILVMQAAEMLFRHTEMDTATVLVFPTDSRKAGEREQVTIRLEREEFAADLAGLSKEEELEEKMRELINRPTPIVKRMLFPELLLDGPSRSIEREYLQQDHSEERANDEQPLD